MFGVNRAARNFAVCIYWISKFVNRETMALKSVWDSFILALLFVVLISKINVRNLHICESKCIVAIVRCKRNRMTMSLWHLARLHIPNIWLAFANWSDLDAYTFNSSHRKNEKKKEPFGIDDTVSSTVQLMPMMRDRKWEKRNNSKLCRARKTHWMHIQRLPIASKTNRTKKWAWQILKLIYFDTVVIFSTFHWIARRFDIGVLKMLVLKLTTNNNPFYSHLTCLEMGKQSSKHTQSGQ